MTDTSSGKPVVSREQSVVDALIEEYAVIHGVGEEGRPSDIGQLHRRIHSLAEPRTALCLSGGGIRSASFGLGILQALAEKDILGKFHYLSTVSGGGYIGAWLTAWRAAVYEDPTIPADAKEAIVQESLWKRPAPGYREPFELTGIRANSNYLTPKLGALSADTWTLVALYIRNLILNWLIYLPLFFALFLIPIGAVAVLQTAPDWVDWSKYLLIIGGSLATLLALITSVKGRLGGTQDKRITQNAYIWCALFPTYVAAMLLSIYVANGNKPVFGIEIGPVSGAGFGAAFYAASWLIAFLAFGSRERFAPEGEAATRNVKEKVEAWRTDLLWSLKTEGDYWLLIAWVICGSLAGLMLGWGCAFAAETIADFRLLAIFGVGWMAVSLFAADSIYLGLTSRSIRGDDEREWLARSSGWFLALTVVWAAFAALVLYAPEIHSFFDRTISSAVAAASGIGLGALAAKIGASAKTLAQSTTTKPAVSLPMTKVLALASVVFLVTIAIVLSSWLADLIALLESTDQAATWFGEADERRHLITVVGASLACAAFFGGFAWFVNVNRFSTHALYRNRLIRAFHGSARGAGGQASESRDPFTGFDSQDNLRCHRLMFPPTSRDPAAPRPRLFHVVNMALNVVSGTNNAWQERKAESFAATPLTVGNEYVGMHPTSTYASKAGGLTLGTAMAISGAAASPNQGYHSSPLVGLVMTLFNVRLGWWLGNPSMDTARLEGPRWGVRQLFQELFGLTTDASDYIYLSDGGHFENLGLYEMIRRRCRMIVVSDAGCDPDCTFEDLGNAVRKIWIDFGVRIAFKKIEIGKRGVESKAKFYYALGKITYPESPSTQAYVLYVKPGFMNNGEEPADVAAYALANLTFPHETTADQFFTESQMESYRSLGYYTMTKILGEPATTAETGAPMEALRNYWGNIQAGQA